MAKRISFDRYRIGTSLQVVALLVGVAVIGMTGLRVIEQIEPLLEASTGYAMEGQMVNSQDIAGAKDGPSTTDKGVITGPLVKALAFPALSYGYFHVHHVGRETTIDGQAPRF